MSGAPLLAALGWTLALAAGGLAWLSLSRRRARDELVVRACHELRSPLTAARLALHSAARHAVAGAAAPLAAVELELRRAGRALEDLSAAREGRRAPERPQLVDLAELLEQVRAAWSPVADAFGAERLRVERPPAGTVVRGDPVRLAQALGNLVGNGLEHGRGRVELRVRRAERAVRVEVQDAGPGLPAPIPELSRAARAGRGRRGRGLAIAAEIARGHGGQLVASPSPGGARLALELPAPGTAGRPGRGGRPRIGGRA